MANNKAYLILMMVMLVWGINVPAIKYLTSQAAPISMTSLRMLIASIVVWIILKAFGLIRRLSKKEWGYVFIGSTLNVVLHHSLMAIGVSMTTATNTSLIIGIGPILTAVLGSLLLKNNPTWIQWGGFVIGMTGIYIAVLFSGGTMTELSMGDFIVFLSVFSQVFSFIIISKVSKTLDPRLFTAYMLLVGSIFLAIIGIVIEPRGFIEIPYGNPKFIAIIIASGAIGTAIGHMLYNNIIPQVGAAKASIFINFNTLVALIGSALLLGEPITSAHWGGLVLIIFGVLLGSGTIEYMIKRKEV